MDYDKIFYQKTPTNREVEWAYYMTGTAGSFVNALCRAYEMADLNNRRRLELAFPYLFGAAHIYMTTDEPEAFIKRLLKEDKSFTDIEENND